MEINKLNRFILLCFVAVGSTACASYDYHLTEFRPLQLTGQNDVYQFIAFADAAYPIDSKIAERTRIKWLERWLNNNHLDVSNYSIISRDAVLKKKGAFGDIYDVYYKVAVRTDETENSSSPD